VTTLLGTRPIKVLLVEDNPGDARLIVELLRDVQADEFDLEHVDRLAPALERLGQAGVDVVLLDLGLPDSNGLDTFEQTHRGAPGKPIIVVSGLDSEQVAVEAVRAGAQDYLVKGRIEGQLLARIIRYAIERQHIRAELTSSQRRMQAIVDTALDGVITMDAAGLITGWNPQAETMFGWPAADVLGRPIADTIIPSAQRSAHQRGLAHFLATGTGPILGKRVELTALRRDGEELPVELTITPIRLADDWLFSAFIRDISERKRAEQEIKQVNESLERRVIERTSELEAFTYSVSHDLRAPLRHVSSFVRILVEEFRDTLAPKAQHYLKRIEDGAQRMGHLVDDLLTLARVGKQNLQVRATPLTPLVQHIIVALKTDITERRIDWRVAELPVVECDAGLMEIALTNLLSNAVKYTRPRQDARIEVGHTTCDGVPTLFVRDNGVGFDMKYTGKLFGVFQRLHGIEEFEGTGVGLATVQRIIHKHGWRVWAEAEVDKGAAFFFTVAAPAIQPSTTEGREVE
jgi:PAS domain S-box-containing protein